MVASSPMTDRHDASLRDLYRRRFEGEAAWRKALWKVLIEDYFKRFIGPDDTVIELAAGGCEFINSIAAKRRIAVDVNDDVLRAAADGVEAIVSGADDLGAIESECADVVFVSNLFEHLERHEILGTLRETARVLRPGGRLIVLQPNIRFVGHRYWMFFDHITPLDHESLMEAIAMAGLATVRVIPRFLPYTTKSRLPRVLPLVRAYLRVPLLWRFLGEQSLVVAEKR